MRRNPRFRSLVALIVVSGAVLTALAAGPVAHAATGDSGPGTGSDTGSQLEQRQNQLDKRNEPTLRGPINAGPTAGSPSTRDGQSSIQGFASASTNTTNGPLRQAVASQAPYDLMTSDLPEATSVNLSDLTLSWKNVDDAAQTGYRITVYLRADLSDTVFDSGWVSSSDQTSVSVVGLAAALSDNQLYYWRVDVQYSDGSEQISSPVSFVTEVGDAFASTSFSWTPSAAVSNLIRTTVPADSGVEKAMLTVTALDTEGARRNVFNAYVNGTEVGLGPTRRAGDALYYNTYDITNELQSGSENVIGLFDYSQATDAGVLMQLVYYYPDGTQQIVYNSGRDRATTQIMPMDSVVYGTSGDSIGTSYYTELAQNADTTRFPYDWQDPSSFTDTSWQTPIAVSTPAAYVLTPSIVAATTRKPVAPATVTHNSDGSWTVDFGKEIIGDISLTASATTKTSIRITLGEQISGGKAVYKMLTGNDYDETWQYQGNDVTFAGYSLMGFRYVTLYNYPGTLTAADISALNTTDSTGADTGSLGTGQTLLNQIYAMGEYSQEEASVDPVDDSVTRERRPYEADTLIYQALTYQTSDNVTTVRNTWNYLLANPSQYTEYRLMTIMGIYADYMHTGDSGYVTQVYAQLQALLNTVTINPSLGLARTAGDTVDLVDWPQSELQGYNLTNTVYKTVINAFAFRAYADMAVLAGAVGDTSDSTAYQNTANGLQSAINSKLYSTSRRAYVDGLTSSGAVITHAVPQDTYVALAMGVAANPAQANDAAETILQAGGQAAGSIYMAYFFYEGLAQTGHGQAAIAYLENASSADVRTYAYVINELGATMSPEAWSPAEKPNMTFSHVWGSGGPIGLVDSILDATPTTPGESAENVTVGLGTLANASATLPTAKGDLSASLARTGSGLTVQLTVPPGMNVALSEQADEQTSSITVDGQPADPSGPVQLGPGTHTIVTTADRGSDTLAVRRGNTYYFKNSLTGGPADTVLTYGKATDTVLVGDWNGDGTDTLAVRRGNTYYFKNSLISGNADTVISYGKPDDTVLVGNWDGK